MPTMETAAQVTPAILIVHIDMGSEPKCLDERSVALVCSLYYAGI